jgi:hypothetical protein
LFRRNPSNHSSRYRYHCLTPEGTKRSVNFEELVLQKLDTTNKKVDTTNKKLDTTNKKVDSLKTYVGPVVKDFARKFFYTADNQTQNEMRDVSFRAKVFEFYYDTEAYPALHFKCMFTGVDLPSKTIIASHLFKFKFGDHCWQLLDFKDINDVRNGLLLFQPLEHAFDRSHIIFAYDKELKKFVLEVLNTDILEMTFKEYAISEKINREFLFKSSFDIEGVDIDMNPCTKNLRHLLDQKFSDYVGKAFEYNFTESKKCYYRCFAFHESVSRLQAVDRGWAEATEIQSPNMWSDFADERVEMVKTWIDDWKEAVEPVEERQD